MCTSDTLDTLDRRGTLSRASSVWVVPQFGGDEVSTLGDPTGLYGGASRKPVIVSVEENVDDSDALLVGDGFLVPGKDRGAVYLVKNPGNPHSEWTVPLTDREGERWFYHR